MLNLQCIRKLILLLICITLECNIRNAVPEILRLKKEKRIFDFARFIYSTRHQKQQYMNMWKYK